MLRINVKDVKSFSRGLTPLEHEMTTRIYQVGMGAKTFTYANGGGEAHYNFSLIESLYAAELSSLRKESPSAADTRATVRGFFRKQPQDIILGKISYFFAMEANEDIFWESIGGRTTSGGCTNSFPSLSLIFHLTKSSTALNTSPMMARSAHLLLSGIVGTSCSMSGRRPG